MPYFQHLGVAASRCGVFFRDLFVRNLWEGGTPLDRCWPPLGHPWSDVDTCLKDFGSNFAPNITDYRATNVTTHTFNQNEARINNTLPINNSSESFFTSAVKQNRVSPKPQFVLKVSRRSSRRNNNTLPLIIYISIVNHLSRVALNMLTQVGALLCKKRCTQHFMFSKNNALLFWCVLFRTCLLFL